MNPPAAHWSLEGTTAEERLWELARGCEWPWLGGGRGLPPSDNCAVCGYRIGSTGAWRSIRYYAVYGVCLDCYYKWKDLNRLYEVAKELMG